MSNDFKEETEFPMYGNFGNLYYGLDDDFGPYHGFIKWTFREKFCKMSTGNIWIVKGLTLYNKFLDKTDDFTKVCEETRHPSGILMWNLKELAERRNTYKKYYWAGWHTQD